jgi:hypothetical protein
MQSLGGGHINSIGKRGDDESGAVAKILITVVEDGISNLKHVILKECIPIALELGLPLELVWLFDSLIAKLFNDIA